MSKYLLVLALVCSLVIVESHRNRGRPGRGRPWDGRFRGGRRWGRMFGSTRPTRPGGVRHGGGWAARLQSFGGRRRGGHPRLGLGRVAVGGAGLTSKPILLSWRLGGVTQKLTGCRAECQSNCSETTACKRNVCKTKCAEVRSPRLCLKNCFINNCLTDACLGCLNQCMRKPPCWQRLCQEDCSAGLLIRRGSQCQRCKARNCQIKQDQENEEDPEDEEPAKEPRIAQENLEILAEFDSDHWEDGQGSGDVLVFKRP